ncbi:MAG: hypothetical protein HRF49_07090 [bacterium]|jgi:CheY-like chemotaxis protein
MHPKSFGKSTLDERIKRMSLDFEGFHNLMHHRVMDVLLVASLYDSYILEGEGHLSELLLSEFLELNLRFSPRFHRAGSAEEALRALDGRNYDLVVTMPRIQDRGITDLAKEIKKMHRGLPIVLLAHNSREIDRLKELPGSSAIDHVFLWQGDLKVFMAITKMIEDQLNAQHDVKVGGVQAIIVIEDSPTFISKFLPLIYTEIMRQTQHLMAEGFNLAHRLLRQGARPKILLARTFEEACAYYEEFKDNLLGVVSDVAFPRRGVHDHGAGFHFIQMVRKENPHLPVLLQSSLADNSKTAEELAVRFLNKNSPTLLNELRDFIRENFGFGDFIFRLPDGKEVGRAGNLKELQEILPDIPDESVLYHASHNHFSSWLKARTEFELAAMLKPISVEEFADIAELRAFLIGVFSEFRSAILRGVVTDFAGHSTSGFTRIGAGSLGGKAHNLAFINRMMSRYTFDGGPSGMTYKLPITAVIATGVFEEFMNRNRLWDKVLGDMSDSDIDRLFLSGEFPEDAESSVSEFVANRTFPLAVRSSSQLEDSQYLPFAGVYRTLMLSNNQPSAQTRTALLVGAIKLVYASTFHKRAKRYILSSPYRIEEERMAVIVQQLVGRRYDQYFYPLVSGVASSHNYYAIQEKDPRWGVASVALGLGKYVVEGGLTWRFCPRFPQSLPPIGRPADLAAATQRYFYALDLSSNSEADPTQLEHNLKKLELDSAEAHGTLEAVGSTYSAEDDRVYDGISRPGQRIVTFAHILKNRLYPMAEAVDHLLGKLSQAVGCPVEIEFAINIPDENEKVASLSILQFRQLVAESSPERISLDNLNPDAVFCRSESSLGNGIIENISDIVYVMPGAFEASKTKEIAKHISALNGELLNKGCNFLLIGPGRWGSSDSWLGIPVDWEDISAARVIIEIILENFKVEPSQGTHFFHNITAHEMGYLTIKSSSNDEFVDFNWLDTQKVVSETSFVRHVRTQGSIRVLLDGVSGRAAILKPGCRKDL